MTSPLASAARRLAGPAVAVASFALVTLALRDRRPAAARAATAPDRVSAAAPVARGAGAPVAHGAGAPGVSGTAERAPGAPSAEALPALPADFALASAAPSLEALARRVTDALGRRDRPALWALTVTRSEYERLLFPRLALDRHAGAGFYFDNLAAGSLRDLGSSLGRLGGRQLVVRGVTTDPAQAERLGEVTVHRGVVLHLLVDGRPVDSSLLGGVVEWRGAFKLTRYRAGDS